MTTYLKKGVKMIATTEGKSVLRLYVSALQAGDTETVRDLFAEDATWTLAAEDLPIAGTREGRDAIVDDFLATARSYFDPNSIEIEITGMTAEDDRVVLQWTSRARVRSGVAYENDCIGVFTVRNGRIHSVREYMDTLYASNTAFGVAAKGRSGR